MSEIRRSYCAGCPYDFGKEDTDQAFNLGCLPGVGELERDCAEAGKAWACHAEPDKVCCGYAAANKRRADRPLMIVPGVHCGRAE